jgi:hypothetical protein
MLAGARAIVVFWAWLTIIDVAAKGFGPALFDVLHGFQVAWQHLRAVLLAGVRAMDAEDIGDFCHHRSSLS